jgi:hypothetical protein
MPGLCNDLLADQIVATFATDTLRPPFTVLYHEGIRSSFLRKNPFVDNK